MFYFQYVIQNQNRTVSDPAWSTVSMFLCPPFLFPQLNSNQLNDFNKADVADTEGRTASNNKEVLVFKILQLQIPVNKLGFIFSLKCNLTK